LTITMTLTIGLLSLRGRARRKWRAVRPSPWRRTRRGPIDTPERRILGGAAQRGSDAPGRDQLPGRFLLAASGLAAAAKRAATCRASARSSPRAKSALER